MDWTLEVVVLPVSDIDASIAFYATRSASTSTTTPRTSTCTSSSSRPAARGARSSSARPPDPAEMAPGSIKGLQLVVADAEAARQELLDRGVECSELMVFSPDDGGTFFGFGDPDGNTWAVQQLKVRGEKPLIPEEHRGRFGA